VIKLDLVDYSFKEIIMLKKSLIVFVLLAFLVPLSAIAGVFDITISSEGQTYTASFNSIQDVIDDLDTAEIEANLSAYTDSSAATGIINFRGVPIYLSIAANSSTLVLDIPAIGVTETFNGTDRDNSVDLIEDWLKENGEEAVTKLMKELIAETPTDPIAGNPSSLESRMVGMDYDYAVNNDEVIEMNAKYEGSSLNANMISIFARYSNYDLDGVSSSTYSLPLAYTIKFNNSRNSLAIRVPIAMVDVDGSKAYNFGLGLGFTYYIKPQWSVTPAVGYTAVGSVDLASVAQLISSSMTSSYNFKINKYNLTMGNMLGYYKTIPFNYGDYSIDADIQNTVLRNGLNLNIPSDNLMKNTSFEVFVTDTRYFGSELFIDQYNEIGASFGFAKSTQKEKKDKITNMMRTMRVGLTYMLADKASGYSVNLGFAF